MKKKNSMTKRTRTKTTPETLEKRFDNNESVVDMFDLDEPIKRVNVDFPSWAVKSLDKEAKRRGVPRQALIKNWIIDRLDKLAAESE